MAESSMSLMMSYGAWESSNDVVETMSEVGDYFMNQEFWFDRTRGNVNRKNFNWNQVMDRVRSYERLLKISIQQLESLGWHCEPGNLDPIWNEVSWLF